MSCLNLYLDIETIPDENRLDFIIPAKPDDVEIPTSESIIAMSANDAKSAIKSAELYMDADQIEALMIAEMGAKDRVTVTSALTSAFTARDDIIASAALDPELCKIVAIGYAEDGGHIVSLLTNGEADIERESLRHVWELVANTISIVGYNVLGFDLPVICVRSIMLGIEPRVSLDWRRYGNQHVKDLMLARFQYGRMRSLSDMARLYGIEIPEPSLRGADVSRMTPDEIRRHVESDIFVTRELHKKLDGYFA